MDLSISKFTENFLTYNPDHLTALSTQQLYEAYLALGGALYDLREFGAKLGFSLQALNPQINWRNKTKRWRVTVATLSMSNGSLDVVPSEEEIQEFYVDDHYEEYIPEIYDDCKSSS